jgi:predicted transcriptional regulator
MPGTKIKTYNVSFNVAGRKSTRVKKILAELGAEQIKVQAKPSSALSGKGEGDDPKTRASLLQDTVQGELTITETRILGLLNTTDEVSFHTLSKVVGSTSEIARAMKRLTGLGLVQRAKLGVYRRVAAEDVAEELGAGGRNAKKLRATVTKAVEDVEAVAREVWEKLSSRDARLLSSIPTEGPCYASDACALAGIKTSRSSYVERLRLKGLVQTFGPPRTQQLELTPAGRAHPQFVAKLKKAPVDFGVERHPEPVRDALVVMGALEEAVATEVNKIYRQLRPKDPAGAVKMAYLEKQVWVRQVKQPGSARPIYKVTPVGADIARRAAELADLPSPYRIRTMLQQLLDSEAAIAASEPSRNSASAH